MNNGNYWLDESFVVSASGEQESTWRMPTCVCGILSRESLFNGLVIRGSSDIPAVATSNSTVSQITSGVSAGDSESIEWFYNQYFELMYLEARRCSGRDESFCLDVVQDATLKVIRSMRVITTEQQLRSWVSLVVRSVVYDLFRQESRRYQREKRHCAQRNSSTADSAALDRTARLAWLEQQLTALDRQSAELLKMRYRLGWTLARIGRALGMKTGAVDGKVRRLLQRLQRNAEDICDDQ